MPRENYVYPVDVFIEGCEVPQWIPYMTYNDLDLDAPKQTLIFNTDEEYISYPAESAFDARRADSHEVEERRQ